MAMSVRRIAAIVIAIAMTSSHKAEARTSDDATVEINKAYAEMSDAWAAHDPQKAVRWMNSLITVTDLSGQTVVLNRDQQFSAARFDMRQTPGTRYFPRQTTVIQELRTDSSVAHVRETTVKELSTVDAKGTQVHVRFVIASSDEWVLTPDGWRMDVYRITSFQRSANGQPSPAVAEALRSMRATNRALRSFDAGINYSNCMNSNQNQSINYESRKAFCGPDH